MSPTVCNSRGVTLVEVLITLFLTTVGILAYVQGSSRSAVLLWWSQPVISLLLLPCESWPRVWSE
jgi:hypothetical protein